MAIDIETDDVDAQPRACTLCERARSLTFHHLIPKKLHKRTRFKKSYSRDVLRDGVMLCRLCHQGLHDLYDEMTLATRLHTVERLRADDAVMRHVAWVEKQK